MFRYLASSDVHVDGATISPRRVGGGGGGGVDLISRRPQMKTQSGGNLRS